MITAKKGFAGSRLSLVMSPQLPGMQGASPVFSSKSMHQVPAFSLQPNLIA